MAQWKVIARATRVISADTHRSTFIEATRHRLKILWAHAKSSVTISGMDLCFVHLSTAI
jgi:hypothetical protein